MILTKARITNFRSIPKHYEISFSPRCRILVGINEAGKSNILKALSLLNKKEDFSPTDIRTPSKSDPQVTESEIIFEFQLVEKDIDEIIARLSEQVDLIKDKKIISSGAESYTLKEFLLKENKVLYCVDIYNGRKEYNQRELTTQYTIIPEWKQMKSVPLQINLKDTMETIDKKIINLNKYPFLDSDSYEELTFEELYDEIKEASISQAKEQHPECIYWEYKEKNILPSKVKLDDFINNPSNYKPLENLFKVADIEDIQKSIEQAKKQHPDHGLQNLLDRVAHLATERFRGVWKNHKEIRFSLREDGAHIKAEIEESNKYGLTQRSEGLKRFVTFFLMVSSIVHKGSITNALILIDEPDNSLHIDACQHLKEDLLNIAKSNYVVYSTHSIFMLDEQRIDRHLVVKKTDEKTTTQEADNSVFDEELIFKSLGYNMFQHLKEKNIFFEGHWDKKLFRLTIENESNEALAKRFAKLGVTNGRGATFMDHFSSLLELAERKIIIVGDNDPASKNKQKDYTDKEIYGTYLTYEDIDPSFTQLTGEDFIEEKILIKKWDEFRLNYPGLLAITTQEIALEKGFMDCLAKKVQTSGLQSQLKKIKSEFKEKLFLDITYEDIIADYKKFLRALLKKVNSL